MPARHEVKQDEDDGNDQQRDAADEYHLPVMTHEPPQFPMRFSLVGHAPFFANPRPTARRNYFAGFAAVGESDSASGAAFHRSQSVRNNCSGR